MTIKNVISILILVPLVVHCAPKIMTPGERLLAIKDELAKGPAKADLAYINDLKKGLSGKLLSDSLKADIKELRRLKRRADEKRNSVIKNFKIMLDQEVSIDNLHAHPGESLEKLNTLLEQLSPSSRSEMYQMLVDKFCQVSEIFYSDYTQFLDASLMSDITPQELNRKATQKLLQYAKAYALFFVSQSGDDMGKLHVDDRGLFEREKVDSIISTHNVNALFILKPSGVLDDFNIEKTEVIRTLRDVMKKKQRNCSLKDIYSFPKNLSLLKDCYDVEKEKSIKALKELEEGNFLGEWPI